MSEKRDKVEQRISDILSNVGDGYATVEQGKKAILNIPELAIVDRKAELPRNPELGIPVLYAEWKDAQRDMLDKGWVKEVKDE